MSSAQSISAFSYPLLHPEQNFDAMFRLSFRLRLQFFATITITIQLITKAVAPAAKVRVNMASSPLCSIEAIVSLFYEFCQHIVKQISYVERLTLDIKTIPPAIKQKEPTSSVGGRDGKYDLTGEI